MSFKQFVSAATSQGFQQADSAGDTSAFFYKGRSTSFSFSVTPPTPIKGAEPPLAVWQAIIQVNGKQSRGQGATETCAIKQAIQGAMIAGVSTNIQAVFDTYMKAEREE